MKSRTSQKNNLSLQLITFVAAVSGMVLNTAIAKVNAQDLVDRASSNQEREFNLFGQQELIAQSWTDIDAKELSLVDNGEKQNSDLLLSGNFTRDRELITQSWTDIDVRELSLANEDNHHEAINNRETIKIERLNLEEQQLIAQSWQDIKTQELSLANEDSQGANFKSDVILISQLNLEQQKIIARFWQDIYEREISLSINEGTEQSEPENILSSQDISIAQLNINEQQVITQTWSEVNSHKFSFAEPSEELKTIPHLQEIEPPKPSRKPVINPPNRQEIAARIALKQVQIVSPAPGVILDSQNSDKVTIQYHPSTKVELLVNGEVIDESLVTQEQLDKQRNLVIKTWHGANLNVGQNSLSLIASQHGIDRKTSREVMVRDTSKVPITASKPELEPKPEQNSIPEATVNTDKGENTNGKNTTESETTSDRQNPQSVKKKGVKILTPKADAVLDTIHSSVIIQYPEDASVILQVNGKSVDTAQVGRTEVNPAKDLVTQTWYGIIFPSGENILSVLSTTDGVNYTETAIKVIVPGRPKTIKIDTAESEIPADGKTSTTVKGEFLDEHGTVVPWNDTVTLKSSEGKFIGVDLEPDLPGFQVKSEKGKFTAKLQAGYDAKMVTILAKSKKLEAYTRVKFKTTLREYPLLSGFADVRVGARGTDLYDSLRDFLPIDEDNDTEIDFTSAAFITGSIGQWSYTGAFNSDRPLNEDEDGETRINRTFSDDDDRYFTYGDESTVENTTPSIDNVYFRLERNPRIELANPDYFMWGDYRTEEFETKSQEFTAIGRQLHGFKANYNLGNLQLNGLYANNIEGFQRDIIAPDGTSGFYFLSRRLVEPGSENVYLELSPLNDPGNVVDRQLLTLNTDYEINYDRGTLLFNDPILSTEINDDGEVLVRRIVTTYQFASEARDADLFAGRGRYHFNRSLNTPTWIGLTYLNEDGGDRDFQLWGMDSYVSLGGWGSISAEYAQSDNSTVFSEANGSAYRLEGKVRFGEDIDGRVYYRETDPGFANNATFSFVPGQVRYGSDIQARIAKNTRLQLGYEHQDNNGVAAQPLNELEEFLELGFAPIPGNGQDNSLTTFSAGLEQKIGEANLGVDLTWRNRTDNDPSGALDSTSTQLRSRLTVPIVENLNFNALNDLTISDDTDALFSDRLGMGLDWEFADGISLFANHQWFTRGNFAGESLTNIGMRGEYEPWTNATLTGSYSVASGIDGISNLGAMGLQQKIVIASGLRLNLNFERTFSGIRNTSSGTQFSQPFAVGQSASSLSFASGTSYGVGFEYDDNPDFTASAGLEYSDRSSGSNTVISAKAQGKLSKSLTALLNFNQASSANQTFNIDTTRRLRAGLAYRNPKNDKFNALFRYEYEENGRNIPETLLLGRGTGSREHLFGIEGIYAPNWRWEFYGKYAFRNSRTFIANDFIGSSNVSLGQLRASYRLNYSMDLVAEGRAIWQPSADYTETGFLLETGYYLTPDLRLSGGYVFGSADDDDFSGTRSSGGAYFGMTVKLNGLFDNFGQGFKTEPESKNKKPKK